MNSETPVDPLFNLQIFLIHLVFMKYATGAFTGIDFLAHENLLLNWFIKAECSKEIFLLKLLITLNKGAYLALSFH